RPAVAAYPGYPAGRLEVELVAVLMQSNLRRCPVIIDEAAFRGVGIARERLQGIDHDIRDSRPRPAGVGMQWLVAIARFVGDPAERPAIGPGSGERVRTLRHVRGGERPRGRKPPEGRGPSPPG